MVVGKGIPSIEHLNYMLAFQFLFRDQNNRLNQPATGIVQ